MIRISVYMDRQVLVQVLHHHSRCLGSECLTNATTGEIKCPIRGQLDLRSKLHTRDFILDFYDTRLDMTTPLFLYMYNALCISNSGLRYTSKLAFDR